MAEASVAVDHDVCIVSGMCASLAPEIFEIDEEGLRLRVLQPAVGPDLAARAGNAAACCPVEAIKVTMR